MSTHPPTVLLAHKSAEVRAFLGEQLPGRYRTRLPEGQGEALRQLRREPPDVVVVDEGLGAEGRRLCEAAKQEADEEIPVVLLGEFAGNEEEETATSWEAHARADTAIEKPFTAGEFLTQVEQHLSEGAGVEAIGYGEKQTDPSKIVRAALDAMERRLGDPDLTTDELAAAADVSRRHLTRRMKAETGRTPAALLRTRRIEEAKRKLRKDPDTIAGVAEAVGFRSPSHFSQVFRKAVGCTPSQYVKRQHSVLPPSGRASSSGRDEQ